MLKGILSKVVGDPNEREVEKMRPAVEAISAFEPDMERRTDAELGALTERFKSRLATGESLDDIMVEAFAAVREVAKRTVDMRPFDVQLIGAIVLHEGKVAEMRTGEGKTLVATMPVYLNALGGRGVHLVTVNDYLARRDALWMAPVYDTLGLSVGLLQSGAEQPAYLYDPDYQRDPYPGLRPVPRRQAYAADVTYGTNNEFGFDYLRDNLALSIERRVQRPLNYAIVDEVDNIFVDEARTPLIISGPSNEPVEEYGRFATIAQKLEPDLHYELDEKGRSVYLSDEGLAIVEQETGIANIYDEANYRYVHYMQQALKAQVLFVEGRDYIRQRKRIILIDHHTGRLMPSRRLSEGLHQAIEAKESVPVRPRDVTSATITIQNYFRMYDKLAGMSGTAMTEGEEFFKIYELDVTAIPTNKPVAREDHSDVVYRSEEAKHRAVARAILAAHCGGQPVLVGTTSVEASEHLSKRLTGDRLQMAALAPRVAYALQDADLDSEERATMRETMNASLETMNSAAWRRLVRGLNLNPNALSSDNVDWIAGYLELSDDPAAKRAMEHAFREGIDHQILNAKEHTREASIIARAGEPGAVTIATNMAGRGVDIKLGGDLSEEVNHKAHLALRARGLDPFSATPAQMDSAIAEVAPKYAQLREQVLAAGGLHVLGTERHEARRIDNQLRGRSGRQGEDGSSRFYLSLEDDLMRRFGRKEMLSKLMETIGDDFPIEHSLVSKTIERAQTSVEGHNFDIRKHLLEYDDVLNRQRETIYGERLRILKSEDLRDEVWRMLDGQAEEYLEKYGEDPDERRFVFAGLDDVVPLILPAPSAPFQGPLTFGSHLTAFPPFAISFMADQLAGQPLEALHSQLKELPQQAAAAYGDQLTGTVSESAQATLEKYDERLDRYRDLIDERIEDFVQLSEERGQPVDIRRLAQHLERTFPLKLTAPRESYQMTGEDLRDHWLDEVEIEFHRATCAAFIERVQIRLPAGVSIDRTHPGRISSTKLADEMGRVQQLALKQPRNDDTLKQIENALPTADPDTRKVLEFVRTVKESSTLDFGRLDRLVGHVLGSHLDDLLGQYLDAVGEEQGRTRRDLERLRGTVVEGKKGRRGSDLPGLLREMNNQVHLEIEDLESLLSLAVGHEYDKWAQRQLAETDAAVERQPLVENDWTAIAEHLLATHYTQRQTYDRGHRRQTSWLPRLPFSFVAQAQTSHMGMEELREAVLTSLHWTVEQRDNVWGQQELQRWAKLSLKNLDPSSRDSLVRFLGEEELGDQRDLLVDDLDPNMEDRLRFVLGLQGIADHRLADLEHSASVLAALGQNLESQILDTPLGDLDGELQDQVTEHLQETGYLDNSSAREQLLKQPVRNWERRTREEVAALLGLQTLATYRDTVISSLPVQERDTATSYLQDQRLFVDEERIQRFLVHEKLADLPGPTRQSALEYLAWSRLNRLQQRKISNLDVRSRQVVLASLQRAGLFTDRSRRDVFLERTLDDLEPDVKAGFGTYLARQQTEEHGLASLEPDSRAHVIEKLKEGDLLAAPGQAESSAQMKLEDLDDAVTAQVRQRVIERLRADLASKTMEELPPDTRKQIHQSLDEHDYFVDEEKVRWYERNTLAHLTPDLLSGLERHLGQIRLAEISDTPFGDLPSETRSNLLELLDDKRLLADRGERLRLTQGGTLGRLSDQAQQALALYIGRQASVQIRNKRPPALPDDIRAEVWVYLRDLGHFADEFKEELFTFQSLDEFDVETHQTIEASLIESLNAELDTQTIGQMAPDRQSAVMLSMRERDLLVDPELLQMAETAQRSKLPPALAQATDSILGEYLLAELGTTKIASLPTGILESLWLYLDQVGYFVDEEKQSQILQRRLADLGNEVLDSVAHDFAKSFAAEISDTPVADLDADMRQRLRQAVESVGYFESDKVKAKILGSPLGSLRREDTEALATRFGLAQLDDWADQSLFDLSEKENIILHLQQKGWFVDEEKRSQMLGHPLRELEAVIRDAIVDTLQRQQLDRLRQIRLSDLEAAQRQVALEALREQGLSVDPGQTRSLRRLALKDLDQDTYQELLRDLGRTVVADWEMTSFQDMSQEQQATLSTYLGRRIMGLIERRVLLHTISRLWVGYLTDIEDLRRGIGLEAYGQRDPLIEYKRKAFELFEELGDNIRRTVVRSLFRQVPEPLQEQHAN